MKVKDKDQIAWDAIENPKMQYRHWEQKGNLLAGQFKIILLIVEARMENPHALLFAFRETFPNLRIYEENVIKMDGRGMKVKI